MPGGYTFAIFDALRDHRDEIRTVLVREEAKAGVMAEVYGRLTGKPGVCMGQGAFLVHASMGAIEAHLSASPMLLLTDLSDNAPLSQHGPYQSGTGEYGSWDARSVFGGFTKDCFVAQDPAHAVHATQLAIKAAVSGEPGPVAVLYWSNALRGRVGPDARPALYSMDAYLAPAAPRRADPAAVEEAAALLRGAERPIIVAGNGVRLAGAYDQLAALADQLGAPVATTAAGKGCYPETGDWALGVMGNFGTPLANAVVGGADVVAGGRLQARPDRHRGRESAADRPAAPAARPDRRRAPQRVLDVPGVGRAAGRRRAHARPARRRRRPGVPGRARRPPGRASDDARLEHGHFDAPELQADKVPILPQRVIGALQEAIPDRRHRHLRRRREPHLHDPLLPDQGAGDVPPAGRRRRHGLRHPRRPGRQARAPRPSGRRGVR